LGVGRADLLNIFLQTLPGIAITYYGEEIKMQDVYISWNDTVDPAACNTDSTVFNTYSRDPNRTPMQWDNTTNAGFSTANKTWLPVSSEYTTNNVKFQNAAANSNLKIFKQLTQLRKTEAAFQEGTYEAKIVNDDIVVYRRAVAGTKPFFIVLNFGTTAHEVDISTIFTDTAAELEVMVGSLNSGFETS
jgi:alpha-glucosidase